MTTSTLNGELVALTKLGKDLVAASQTLRLGQVRWLVDMYYWAQKGRKRAANQINASMPHEDDEIIEPHEVMHWVFDNMDMLEENIKKALNAYAEGQVVGRWLKSIPGIGPVISSGLLAHVNIEHCPTVGHLWRFAGQDPTVEWLGKERATALVQEVMGSHRQVRAQHLDQIASRTNRKLDTITRLATNEDGKLGRAALVAGLAKRPWNSRLKVLVWSIGQSFQKISGRERDIYGKIYVTRKAYENAKNEQGDYAAQAAAKLDRYNIRIPEIRAYYESGRLPPGHIIARACRYTSKLFLSHVHHVMYEVRYGVAPPKPYIMNQPGHTHFLAPPNWPM